MSEKHKKNWFSANWFKVLSLVIFVGTIAGGFYWYSYRPTEIKKSCAFVTKTRPAIAYRAAMTEEQMQKAGMIEDCNVSNNPFIKSFEDDSLYKTLNERRKDMYDETCKSDNKKRIAFYTKEQKAEPAKLYQDKATDEEYLQCLREKGL